MVAKLIRPSRRNLLLGASAAALAGKAIKANAAWPSGGSFPVVAVNFGNVATDRINMLFGGGNMAAGVASLFDTGWSYTNGSGNSTNTATAPDGTTTAATFTDPNFGTSSTFAATQTGPTGNSATAFPLRFAFYVKADTLTRCALQITQSSNGQYAGFDLSGVRIAYGPQQVGTGGPQITNQVILSKANGWCLCYVDFSSAISSPQKIVCELFMDNGSGTGSPSLSFTSNATHKLFLWKNSLLPVSCWTTFSRQIFHDDFTTLSHIDTSATFAPGFTWYPYRNLSGTANNTYSVSDSVLTLTCTNPVNGAGLMTSFFDLTTNKAVGTFNFTPPFYIESSIAADPTLSPATTPSNSAWPALWTLGDFVNNLPVNSQYVEHDFFEFFPEGTGAGNTLKHTNVISWSVGTDVFNVQFSTPVWNTTGSPVFDNTHFHTYGYLFLPSVNSGANALRMTFFDGVFVSGTSGFSQENGDFMWINSSGVTDPSSGFDTTYPAGNTQVFPLALTGGSPSIPWPLNIDYVSVYK